MTTAPERRLQKPAIFVCDLQEKFRNAIWEFEKVVLTTNKLLKAASALSIPVYATTQNGARLGATVPEIQSHLESLAKTPTSSSVSDSPPLLRCLEDKTRFSMWIPPVAAHFQSSAPAEICIVGIESHICVTQTALDALAAGHKVYIMADGVSSCNREEVPIALARLRAAGATVTTSESWLYEVMGDAGIGEFRKIVGLVKETSQDTKTALGALQSKI
ncbi:isochorismatase [Zalerion maritima]|uniref:Isochorismatase n=1 Tax=Zalerion maritima TaxID=339359 RepID=A0AAD5RPF7_9PEZI|nr:isochorismatase [Zalerion maritima]